MTPELPKVLAYHALVHVFKDNLVYVLTIDWPDWAKGREILAELARRYRVSKVGEALTCYLRDQPQKKLMLSETKYESTIDEVFSWDEKVA